MPKAKRNANLSRVARRRVANADNLPSSAARKVDDVGSTTALQSKDENTPVSSRDKGSTSAGEKKLSNVDDTINGGRHTQQHTQQLSRGQRKRQAKREQFLRKEKMILSSLMLQRQEQQKKRIDGLDAIKQALMDTTEKNEDVQNRNRNARKPVQHIATNKAKRKIVAKEIEHVNLILQHPAFKTDPFETMQEHLRNTFAAEREQQELLSKKRTEEEKRKVETKRTEKKGIKKKSQKKKYKPRRTR